MKWTPVISAFKCSSPKIAIHLRDPKLVYTTWDRVEGTITVIADDETSFDNVDITFEGSSRVSLLRPMTLNREITASHTFLKLQQPLNKIEYPTSHGSHLGRSYTYPFMFIIPEDLPLGSCIHSWNKAHDCQEHFKPPPTLYLDNLSQELCRISYFIRVTVSRGIASNGKEVIAATTRNVRFIPTSGRKSHPSSSHDYPMLNDPLNQRIKKSLGLGRLTVVTASSQLNPPISNSDTCINVQIRFDPVGATEPPKIQKLHTSLKVLTVLNAKPLATQLAPNLLSRGAHVEIISLPSTDVSTIGWVKHVSPRFLEPNSNTREPTSAAGLYYTSSIIIPLGHSDLLPTFQSCLVTRTYHLNLNLSCHIPGKRGGRQTLKLQAPVNLRKAYYEQSRMGLQYAGGRSKLPHIHPPPPSYTDQESIDTWETASWRTMPPSQMQADKLPEYPDVVS